MSRRARTRANARPWNDQAGAGCDVDALLSADHGEGGCPQNWGYPQNWRHPQNGQKYPLAPFPAPTAIRVHLAPVEDMPTRRKAPPHDQVAARIAAALADPMGFAVELLTAQPPGLLFAPDPVVPRRPRPAPPPVDPDIWPFPRRPLTPP